ncbi:Predicted acyltransferase [gamma proteobacterium HdN1]|nr:Predicted acyltransferase [gamma proteobacterium HdN1]
MAPHQVRFIPELESARGWAILLVVLFHYLGILNLQQMPAEGVWQRLISAGNTGVTLFFVLSGFLLSRPVVAAFQTDNSGAFRSFVIARVLRIFPLYYLVVLAAFLFTSKLVALKGLLFIPIGFAAFPYSVPWWSLSVEMQFYVFLAVILLGIRYGAGRWWIAGLVGVFIVWHILLLSGQVFSRTYAWHNSFPGRFPAFLFGALIAYVYDRDLDTPWGRRRVAFYRILSGTALAALLGLLYWYGGHRQEMVLRIFPAFHDLEALLWALVLLCLLRVRSRLKRLFVNRVMNYFGEISYSVYLLHVPAIFYITYPFVLAVNSSTANAAVERALAELVFALALSVAATLGLSTLSWHWIEKPFLSLKRMFRTEKGKKAAIKNAKNVELT